MRKFLIITGLLVFLIIFIIFLPPFQEFAGRKIGRITGRNVSMPVEIEGLRFGVRGVRLKRLLMGEGVRVENVSMALRGRRIRWIKVQRIWVDPKKLREWKKERGEREGILKIPIEIPLIEVECLTLAGVVDSVYARISVKRDGIVIEKVWTLFYGKEVNLSGNVRIDEKISVHDFEVLFGENKVKLDGDILPELSLSVDGELADFEGIFPLKGRISLTFSVSGDFRSPEAEGSIGIEGIEYEKYRVDSGRIELVYRDGNVRAFPELEVYGGKIKGEIRGNIMERRFRGVIALRGINPEEIAGIPGDVNLDVSFSMNRTMGFSIALLPGRMRDMEVVSGVVRGKVKGRNIEIDTLHLEGEGYTISANGSMEKDILDFAFSLDGFELGKFLPDAEGKVFVNAGVFGPVRKPRIIGTFFMKRLSFRKVHMKYLAASFNLVPQKGWISGELELKGDSIVSGKAVLPSMSFVMKEDRFSFRTRYMDKDVRIAGVLGKEVIFVDSLYFDEIENRDIMKIKISPFEFTGLLLEGAGLRIEGKGKGREIHAGITLRDLRKLGIFMKLRQVIKGNGEIQVDFSGKKGRVEGRIKEFVFEDAGYDSILFRINLEGRDVKIDKMELWSGGEISRICGVIPGKGEMEVSVRIGRLGRWIFIPARTFMDVYRGIIGVDLVLRGTLQNPLIYGTVSIDSLAFYIPQLNKHFTELSGEIKFRGDRIFIDSLEGKTGKIGTVLVYGNVKMEGKKVGGVDLVTEIRRFSIKDWNEMDVKLDGDVTIKGIPPALEIGGEVDIKEAVLRMGFQRRKGGGGKQPPIKLDLTVNMPRNVWIRNEFADMQLGGKLRVKKEKLPEIEGEMKVLGGYFYYLDKPFRVEKGVFSFKGGRLNPRIELLAKTTLRYREGEEEIEGPLVLEVGGELFSPTFNLYTEPPLPPLALEDIIPLINVDMKWEELASMERAGKTLLTKAGMIAVRTMVLSKIQKIGIIDNIDLEANLFGEEKSTKITIGKRLFGNVYATYTKDILAKTPDQFKIQWNIRRNFMLLGERDEDGNYFGGVEWRIRW